jgi:hypothetical protein
MTAPTERELLDRACALGHRNADLNPSDRAALELVFGLIGVSPLADIPPDASSLEFCFRRISHQERYAFVMSSLSKLLETPCRNTALKDLFVDVSETCAPVSDMSGNAVVDAGLLSFGQYSDASIVELAFSR